MITLYIGLGGALGAVARAWTTGIVMHRFGTDMPYGTLAVNSIGALLIGMVSAWLLRDIGEMRESVQALIITGFLGGFTTFSAFSLQLFTMLHRGDWLQAVGYGALSLILTLIACAAGFMAVKAML